MPKCLYISTKGVISNSAVKIHTFSVFVPFCYLLYAWSGYNCVGAKIHKPSFSSHKRSDILPASVTCGPCWSLTELRGIWEVDTATYLYYRALVHFWVLLCKTKRGSLNQWFFHCCMETKVANNRSGNDEDPNKVCTCRSYGNHLWYWRHFEEQSSIDDRIPLGNENVLR